MGFGQRTDSASGTRTCLVPDVMTPVACRERYVFVLLPVDGAGADEAVEEQDDSVTALLFELRQKSWSQCHPIG